MENDIIHSKRFEYDQLQQQNIYFSMLAFQINFQTFILFLSFSNSLQNPILEITQVLYFLKIYSHHQVKQINDNLLMVTFFSSMIHILKKQINQTIKQ
ncbi:hypothetical protein pb186bvf_016093 [Paramecium bursaria]